MPLLDETPAPEAIAEAIHADGVLLGNAMQHMLGVQFLAVDRWVKAMDRSIWPSSAYAARAARQMFLASRSGRSF
jgi:hypothetical protein